MKILAHETEIMGITEDQFTPELLKEEALRAWELYQAGIIREIYFREDRNEAIIILECDSIASAEDAINSLPLVKAGLIKFEITRLLPYDGFKRLFAFE